MVTRYCFRTSVRWKFNVLAMLLMMATVLTGQTDIHSVLRLHGGEGLVVVEVSSAGLFVTPLDGSGHTTLRRLNVKPYIGRVSPSGHQIVVWSSDDALKIIDLDTAKELTVPGRFTNVDCIALSPNGNQIAFNGVYKPLGSGNLNTKINRAQWKAGLQYVLTSSGEVSPIQLVHSAASSSRLDLPSCESVGWSPDGRRLVYSDAGAVKLFDVASRASTFLADGSAPTWSPDGQWIAYRDNQGRAVCVSPAGNTRRILLNGQRVWGPLQWSPDSTIVLVSAQTDQSRYSEARLMAVRLEDSASADLGGLGLSTSNRDHGWAVIHVP